MLNRAGKACKRCGVVPPERMSHSVCRDCSRVRELGYKWDKYHNDPVYRARELARQKARYRPRLKSNYAKT